MSDQDSYAISEIIESGSFSGTLLMIVGLCFLLMVCDSYDVAALSFAAPVLIKAWALTPQDMGLVFSAGLFGLLVGSVLFGWVGDHFGRKRAMIVGALGFSALTAATGLAGSMTELLILRFVATIGLGGAVPNAVALTAEFTPRSRRITAVGIIFAGYTVGGIAAGLSAAYVIGTLGWRAMFLIGGGMSLIVTATFVALPESLAFLAAMPRRRLEALRVAGFLRPDLRFGPKTQIMPDVSPDAPRARFAELFRGPLCVATPMMWIIYIANSITVFSLTSWMPFAVESVGSSRSMAAVATAVLFAGGAVGGIAGGRLADRIGVLAVAALATLAFPSVAALGALGEKSELLPPVSFLAGCFAMGGQTCLHGVVGSLYATNVRANGVGWAIGIAKIGSIAGPFIGGLLLPRVSGGELFLAAASPLLIVATLALALKLFLSASQHKSLGMTAVLGNFPRV